MKKSRSTKKSATKKAVSKKAVAEVARDYDSVLSGVVELLQEARRASARTVNAIMTATYWEVGRQIVECEQGGKERAGYGKELIQRLSVDLTSRFGRGFGVAQLHSMRQFHLAYPAGSNDFGTKVDLTDDGPRIFQSVIGKSPMALTDPPPPPILQSVIGKSEAKPSKNRQSVIDESGTDLVPLGHLAILQSPIEKSGSLLARLKSIADAFPLSWTHYVRLLRVRNLLGREYRLLLPDEKLLADELTRTRRLLEARLAARTTRRKT